MATNPNCAFSFLQFFEDEEDGSVNEQGLRHFHEEAGKCGGSGRKL